MIINEDFLGRLRKEFNLNLYEVKLWAAILSRGVSTAGELSDIADVPRSRTYDVLESLERKGFVMVKPEKPIKYMAIPPEEVLSRVQKKVRENMMNYAERLEKLKGEEMMKELVALYNQGIEPMQVTDFSGALKGRHNIYDQLGYVIKEAQESISIITSEDGLIRKLRHLKPLIEKAVARGVKIRIIAPLNQEGKTLLSSFGESIKFQDNRDILGRFCIVDGKHVVFMMTGDDEVHPSYDMGFWLKSDYFAKTLDGMFQKLWPETSSEPSSDPL
tara:strand:- start:1601 stop:2422 length:822 start_codon:yes stop_codon:yes gene_type:complete